MTYKILVGVDRDNTINMDIEGGYFGKDPDWREKLEFCSDAVEGLKLLSQNSDIALVVLTAQVGVARGVFSAEHVEQMHLHMDAKLRENGVKIQSWQYCPYVNQKGAKRWEERGISTINYDYVLDDADERLLLMKPHDGLLKKAATELGINYSTIEKYVLGDRASDVECGLNAGGIGILVNNPAIIRGNTTFDSLDSLTKYTTDDKYQNRIHVVQNLVEAAKIICK